MDTKLLDDWQKSITSDIKSALEGKFDKTVAARTTDMLEARLASLTDRASALEQLKKISIAEIDQQIADTKAEISQVKVQIKGAKKPPKTS
jgi:uncharacterized small protein (DUF1192 family)